MKGAYLLVVNIIFTKRIVWKTMWKHIKESLSVSIIFLAENLGRTTGHIKLSETVDIFKTKLKKWVP